MHQIFSQDRLTRPLRVFLRFGKAGISSSCSSSDDPSCETTVEVVLRVLARMADFFVVFFLALRVVATLTAGEDCSQDEGSRSVLGARRREAGFFSLAVLANSRSQATVAL